MRQTFVKRLWMVALLGAALGMTIAGCAIVRPSLPPVSDNAAVVSLVDSAHADADAGRFPNAVASLERALRVEPKNPRLWHEFARVRMKEGDYAQAENLAARSNSWAGDNKDLRVENWNVIAEARARRGDKEGAKAAVQRAEEAKR